MRRRSGPRGLAAVLFTDIVDSSAIASRLGNARWKELIARHHAEVRRELKRFGGRELDTAGDGFFASFGDPASALRCAAAVADAVRELGIEIRAGVHFGTVEQSGDKLAGIAVVVGARVMSLGGAGDILTTSSTGDLVAGAGFGFEDRGDHSLKGLDGTWRVLAVTRVDGEPRATPPDPDEAERRLASVQPSRLGAAKRKPWLVASALVVVLALVAAIIAMRSGDPTIEMAADSVGRIDTESGELGTVTAIGSRPGGAAVGLGSVWVTAPDRGVVVRLDAETGAISDTIAVGNQPSGATVFGDAVWVSNAADGTISRIDPATNEPSQTYEAGTGPTAITAGDGTLWVTDPVASKLLRIDPATGETTEVPLSGKPSGVAVASDGGVWVTVAPASLARVDPESAVITSTVGVGNGPTAVTSAFGSMWVANSLDGTVSRIDPITASVRALITVGGGPNAIAAAADRLWVADELGDRLSLLDPMTNTTDRIVPIGTTAAALAVEGETLWLAAGASASQHFGGTLRIATDGPIDSLDPATSYDANVWRMLTITNDGLVTYKKVGGPDGATVVPDLAVALPQISEDRRRYTFTLREGIRYSTGEPVRPEDVRHSIERAVTLLEGASAAYGAIVGVRKCFGAPGRCDLSDAIVADGNIVTIHLSRPDPDLLYKLALTWASVLPADLPMQDQGIVPLPATGPYMVSEVSGGTIELARNPEFREFSRAAQPDGFVDAVSWRVEEPTETSFGRILDGDVDLMGPPDVDDLSSLLAEHPDQVVSSSDLRTWWVGLNVRQPPFDDPRVRQAVSFAIDREHIVDLLGGAVQQRLTCQILPPGMAGYEPFCPHTLEPGAGEWSAPDLERARDLIAAAGAAGQRVEVSTADAEGVPPGFAPTMRYVTDVLDGLGLDARLTVHHGLNPYIGSIFSKAGTRSHPQAFILGWSIDFPRTSSFIETQFRCDSPSNVSGYCDGALDARIDQIKALEATDPGAGIRAWTAIEHDLVEQVVQVPLANSIANYPTSARAGNVQVHVQWGVLISRIWVQ